jgi:hypothetical protein
LRPFFGAGSWGSLSAGAGFRGFFSTEAEALFFTRALGVEHVEAIDDLVLEGLPCLAVFVGAGAIRRDGDVDPALGVEHGAVHLLVEPAELEDARIV